MTPPEKLEESLKRQLEPGVSDKGTVDVDLLRKNNPPLAEVLDEFVMSKTTRDDQPDVVKDLARVLEARDPKSRLSQALEKLERHMRRGSDH